MKEYLINVKFNKRAHRAIALMLVLLGLIQSTALIHAQSAHKQLRSGDSYYRNDDLKYAEKAYRKSGELNPSFKSEYNLGNSLYGQKRFDESSTAFEKAIPKGKNDNEKSDAWHNLGNSLFQQEKYKESIEAYKNSLKYNSANEDSKTNLMLARTMLKQKINQQNQQNQQNQDQKKDQQDSSQQDQNQDQNQNQNKDQNKDSENQRQEAESGDKNQNKMKKEDAEKLLEIIGNEDKKVQEKLRRSSGSNKKTGKDW